MPRREAPRDEKNATSKIGREAPRDDHREKNIFSTFFHVFNMFSTCLVARRLATLIPLAFFDVSQNTDVVARRHATTQKTP